MRNACLGVFMLILAFSSCSKGKENSALRIPDHEKNAPLRPPAAASQGGSALRIASLTLAPEAPSVLDDVTAVPELADPGREDVEFRYQWYINGKEVEQAEGDTLQKSSLKKGAWLFCQARATDGQRESPYLRSDIIQVRNSPPLLDLAPVGEFGIPGEFLYQAAAGDADNDELKFELLSPLEQGIALDPQSGALSWKLTEDIVKALGEKVEIRIAVSDGEAKAEGTITLQFSSATKKAELP